jgi:hypothetical protein
MAAAPRLPRTAGRPGWLPSKAWNRGPSTATDTVARRTYVPLPLTLG